MLIIIRPYILVLLHPVNSLSSRTTWVSWYQKGKTSLDLNEARDDGVWGWQWHQLDHKCKQSAPRSREITTPTPYNSTFYRSDALPDAQITASKPSVLWRCWLGSRKGIRSVKNWVVGCWRGYSLCTAPWSGTPCRTTSAHSRTMSESFRQSLKNWLFSRY